LRIFTSLDISYQLASLLYQERMDFLFSFPNARLIPLENYHITLQFLGDITPREAEIVSYLLEKSANTECFNFTTAGLGQFPGKGYPRVIFEEIGPGKDNCKKIHRRFSERLIDENFKVERKKYLPHITLCRLSHSTISKKLQVYSPNDFIIHPLEGTVKSLSIYQSQLTQKGAIYKRLAQFPLIHKT
jgi:2'-5' RNA ligase